MEAWWNLKAPENENVADELDGFVFALREGACPQEITAKTIRLSGNVPPESWCRLGTQVLPKLGTGTHVRIGIHISATVEAGKVEYLKAELRQVFRDLGLMDSLHLEP
jgi:hypothetical protein